MARYYKYNSNFYYLGFEDSDVVIPSSTTVAPTSTDHVLWDNTNQLWIIPQYSQVTLNAILDKLNSLENKISSIKKWELQL